MRIFFIFLLVCLTGCVKSGKDIGDGGFISGEPCGPPCFLGIVPGVTTSGEVMATLEENGIVEGCEPFDLENQGGWKGLSCPPTVGIFYRNGTDVIESIGFEPAAKITVGQVIEKYGEPDAVSIGLIGIPEYPKTAMRLFFEEMQVAIGMESQEGGTFTLGASTTVGGIGYYDDASFELQIRKGHWKGYGVYRVGE